MNDMRALLRQFFRPLLELVAPFSIQTGILLLLGPLFVGLARPFIYLRGQWESMFFVPFIVAGVLSALVDLKKISVAMAWITKGVLISVVALMAVSIITVPKRYFHDEFLVTEVALDGITQGINPYSRDFRGTIFDTWIGNEQQLSWIGGEHPSARHYVYLPGHLIVSMPFYLVFKNLFGWYDQRIVYLAAFILLLVVAWRSLRYSSARDALMLAFVLNPFVIWMFYGLNDIVMMLFLALTGFALARGRTLLAAIVFGSALAMKQPALIAIPFLLPALWRSASMTGHARTLVAVIVAAIALLFIIPFFLWSPAALWDDTVRFFVSGTAYPIGGEGVGELLLQIGVVSPNDSFPFWVFELLFGVPILIALSWWAWKKKNLEITFFAATIGIAAVWFFSRYFLLAHVHVIIMLTMISFLVGEAERRRVVP